MRLLNQEWKGGRANEYCDQKTEQSGHDQLQEQADGGRREWKDSDGRRIQHPHP